MGRERPMSPHVHVVRHDVAEDSTRPPLMEVARANSYPITIVRSAQTAIDHLLAVLPPDARVAIVTDQTVDRLYATALTHALAGHGFPAIRYALVPGETSKDIATAVNLLDWLADSEIARRDVLLAVGGGVVIDTAGWVASAYMRGIPYVNVPTTLLAQVDAAIGGKVAVDHRLAKNLVGAFYHPIAVVSNVDYLASLSSRQIRGGLAEAIKKGIIASPGLFGFIEQNLSHFQRRDAAVLHRLVQYAAAVKCHLVNHDPFEYDLRRPLNFGHTIGHAIETVTGYGPVLHGEAVSIGMACATQIANRRGWIEPTTYHRILTLLERAGLPVTLDDLTAPVDADAMIRAMAKIRLIRGGTLHFVLPLRMGETAVVDDVTDAEIYAALDCAGRGAGDQLVPRPAGRNGYVDRPPGAAVQVPRRPKSDS